MYDNVVLVDDHQLVRDGFTKIIETSINHTIIGSFSGVDETIHSGALMSCDVLITDISLDSELDGFDLINALKQINPMSKIIIVSMYESTLYLQQAKKYGVNGYIHKREASEQLLQALHAIRVGDNYFSGELASKLNSAEVALEIFNNLYPRELEVFLLLAKGASVKKVAADLNIAIKTVHTHRLNLYKKFGLSSPFELTKFCLKHGILDKDDF